MPSTSTMGFPYPDPNATPDGPYAFQQLAESVDAALGARPRCRIQATGTPSIANTTTTAVTFTGGTVDYDNNAMADLANSKIIIKTAGWYRLTARFSFAANATGYRAGLIRINTSTVYLGEDYRMAAPTLGTMFVVHTEPILCAVNDFITAEVNQSSGAALTLVSANGRHCYLAAHWAFKA